MVRWENISKYGMMRVEKIKRKLHGNTGSSIGLSRRAWRSIANRNHTGYPLRRRLLDDLSSKVSSRETRSQNQGTSNSRLGLEHSREHRRLSCQIPKCGKNN